MGDFPRTVERRYPVSLNIGCDTWQTNTAMRYGFCELLFAGCGNHPGLWDGDPNHEFDAGDKGINNVHRQWAEAKVRSMSVGDVVLIDWGGMNEYWVCDSCGWILLTPEQFESWRTFPRQYIGLSLDLNKWMETLTTSERLDVKCQSKGLTFQ